MEGSDICVVEDCKAAEAIAGSDTLSILGFIYILI